MFKKWDRQVMNLWLTANRKLVCSLLNQNKYVEYFELFMIFENGNVETTNRKFFNHIYLFFNYAKSLPIVNARHTCFQLVELFMFWLRFLKACFASRKNFSLDRQWEPYGNGLLLFLHCASDSPGHSSHVWNPVMYVYFMKSWWNECALAWFCYAFKTHSWFIDWFITID